MRPIIPVSCSLRVETLRELGVAGSSINLTAIIEAITDLIHDASGDGYDMSFEDDDHYDSFEETDFSQLESVKYE